MKPFFHQFAFRQLYCLKWLFSKISICLLIILFNLLTLNTLFAGNINANTPDTKNEVSISICCPVYGDPSYLTSCSGLIWSTTNTFSVSAGSTGSMKIQVAIKVPEGFNEPDDVIITDLKGNPLKIVNLSRVVISKEMELVTGTQLDTFLTDNPSLDDTSVTDDYYVYQTQQSFTMTSGVFSSSAQINFRVLYIWYNPICQYVNGEQYLTTSTNAIDVPPVATIVHPPVHVCVPKLDCYDDVGTIEVKQLCFFPPVPTFGTDIWYILSKTNSSDTVTNGIFPNKGAGDYLIEVVDSNTLTVIASDSFTLTQPPLLTDTTVAYACTSYYWPVNGVTYTASGTYTFLQSGGAANGCDILQTVEVIIDTPINSIQNQTACDSYTWSENGQTYTNSGTYMVTYPPTPPVLNYPSAGALNDACALNYEYIDSVAFVNIANTSTCSAGMYQDFTAQTAALTAGFTYPLIIQTQNSYVGDMITVWFDWNQNGLFNDTGEEYSLSFGNITTANITIPVSAVDGLTRMRIRLSYEDSISYTGNAEYGEVEDYSVMISGGAPYPLCGDTAILNLTINTSTFNTTTATACDTYTWAVDGNTYTASGTYTFVGTNAGGCTHTETLILTIDSSTSNTTNITACDTYTWAVNNLTYNLSGTYTSMSINAAGCNHTEILNLTINNSSSTQTTLTVCGSYTWPADGLTYTSSGTYVFNGILPNGCSDQQTLLLTILPLPVVTAPVVATCIGQPVNLGGTPTGGSWNLPNPYFGNATSYTYYYTDMAGCTGSATASIGYGNLQAPPLTFTSVSGISAVVTYPSVAGTSWYELRYKPISASTFTTVSNGGSLTKILNGLSSNTTYVVQIRCNCGTQPGPWGAFEVFTTNNDLLIPQNLFATNIGLNTVTLNWTAVAGSNSYSIRLRPVGSASWSSSTSLTNIKNVVSLVSGTNYEFQVKANITGVTTGYSASALFTTLSSCSDPTGLFASNITSTSAQLHWTAVATSTLYTVRYRPIGGSVWTTNTTVVNSKSIAGLGANTSYEFQVRAQCGVGTSNYSSSANFTTLTLKSANPTTLAKATRLQVYPNPVQEELRLVFSSSCEQTLQIQLYDISGRLLKNMQWQVGNDQEETTLDVSSLAAGTYLLHVIDGENYSHIERIIKE